MKTSRWIGLGAAMIFAGAVAPLRAQTETAETPKSVPAFSVEVTGTGRPMILIPGLASGGNVWDGTVEHFKGTYQCHVFTLAGFGGQPPIGKPGEPFLEQIRDGLCAYIREQKLDRPVIVGHSLGAFLAFWIGATIPEKVGAIVAVDGVPFFPALRDATATPQSAQAMAFFASAPIKLQTPEQFSAGNRAILRTMITDPKERDRIAAVSDRSAPSAVGAALYEIMTTDLRAQVSAIKAPVLLIGATAGMTDPEQKRQAEANYQAQVGTIPEHRVVFAPKARHFVQLDEPAFLFEQMESFLRQNPGNEAK